MVLPERPSLAQTSRVFSVAESKPGFWSRFGNPRDQRIGFNLVSMLQLVVASFIGVAIFAFMTGQFEFGRTKRAPETPAAQPVLTAAPAVQATAPAIQAAALPTSALPFAPPPNYGVYALNNGQLIELDRMPMRMPDPRVMLSPEISMPVRVTLPNGKPTFVIYRRDLVAASQDKVPARVVARIARELTFKNGMAVTNNLKGIWRVRNISYDLQGRARPRQRRHDLGRTRRQHRTACRAATRWCSTAWATTSPSPERSRRRSNAWRSRRDHRRGRLHRLQESVIAL